MSGRPYIIQKEAADDPKIKVTGKEIRRCELMDI